MVPTSVPATIPPTPYNPLLSKPTESIPESQSVISQEQKDHITAMITVIYAGGPGANSISGGDVTVTSDDGTVQTGTIRPSEGKTELVLKGTKGKDRVEVVARMFSGRTYRVIDEFMSCTEPLYGSKPPFLQSIWNNTGSEVLEDTIYFQEMSTRDE